MLIIGEEFMKVSTEKVEEKKMLRQKWFPTFGLKVLIILLQMKIKVKDGGC